MASETDVTKTAGVIATVVGFISICNGLGRVLYGWVFDRSGRKATMIAITLEMLLSAVLLALALNTHSFILLVVSFVGTGLAYGGVVTMNSAFVGGFYGKTNYPVNFSIVNMNLMISSLGGIIAGMLYDHSGSFVSTCVFMAISTIIGFISLFLIRRP